MDIRIPLFDGGAPLDAVGPSEAVSPLAGDQRSICLVNGGAEQRRREELEVRR